MRRGTTALLPALALLLSLCGCAAPSEDAGPVLWFAGDVSDWSMTSAAMGSEPYAGPVEAEPMVRALLAGPEEAGLHTPFPEGTALLSCDAEGGLLRVDLSQPYGRLTGFDLTLANYCLTLTLTQIPGVDRVRVTVEGRPLGEGQWEELRADQAVLSGAEERPVEVAANLYFPRAAGRGLGVEARVFQLTEGDVLAQKVMEALLAGPAGEELSSAIPEGVGLRSIHMEDGVCYVDLTRELLDGLPEGEEAQTLLVYSVVNTLGNLSTVNSVCLLVEGEALTQLGQMTLPPTLEPDFGLARN